MHPYMNISNPMRIIIPVAMLWVTVPSYAATVIANFDGGNSTSVVDAYQGKAGNGWTGAWSTAGTNSISVTGLVASASPLLSGSGNYLTGTIAGPTSNNANSQGYIGRVVSATSFDYAVPLQLSFLYRPDTTLSGSQRYRILGNANSVTGATGPSNLFTIDSGTTATPTWNFGGAATSDSGLSVIAGDTYSFTLSLDMHAHSYTATVLNLTTSDSWTSSSIGFRNTATVSDFALELGALIATGGAQTSANQVHFSADSISISNIPEPTTIAALMGAGVLGMALIARRRKAAATSA